MAQPFVGYSDKKRNADGLKIDEYLVLHEYQEGMAAAARARSAEGTSSASGGDQGESEGRTTEAAGGSQSPTTLLGSRPRLTRLKKEMSERGLLGSPALLEVFRGPDGKRVPLTRVLMGLPNPPRDWMLLLRREYSDARRVEAEMLQKAGRGRVLRALASAVSRVPLAGVAGVALALAVVVGAVAIAEHPLLVRVAQAGQA